MQRVGVNRNNLDTYTGMVHVRLLVQLLAASLGEDSYLTNTR